MPELANVHVDQALTNVAINYGQGGFISPRLLAPIAVGAQTGKYYKFDTAREFIRRPDDQHRAGTIAKLVDFDVTNAAYSCEGHALAAAVTREEIAQADAPIQPFANKVNLITQKLLVSQEIDLKAKLDAALVSSLTSDPTNEWDDETNGDPFADIHLAINTIEDGCGFAPNVIAMDAKVFRALVKHPSILERVMYGGSNTDPANVGPGAIAALFGLSDVIVGSAMYNTAAQGQTASVSRIWGSDVYVAYRPALAMIDAPALGYRFEWAEFSGGQFGFSARQWYSDERDSQMVELKKYYDQEICLAAAGYRLQNRLS